MIIPAICFKAYSRMFQLKTQKLCSLGPSLLLCVARRYNVKSLTKANCWFSLACVFQGNNHAFLSTRSEAKIASQCLMDSHTFHLAFKVALSWSFLIRLGHSSGCSFVIIEHLLATLQRLWPGELCIQLPNRDSVLILPRPFISFQVLLKPVNLTVF